MARLLADEDFPKPTVDALRAQGREVVTVQELKLCGLRDREILESATARGRALISHNRKDFRLLHQQTQGRHAGIVVCTRDADFLTLAERISSALASENALEGRLIQVRRPAK